MEVEITCVEKKSIVLQARASELLILPQHVLALGESKSPKEFSEYFMAEALVNRSARKLFQAWLRKDRNLWQRLYRTIRDESDAQEIRDFLKNMGSEESEAPVDSAPKEKTPTVAVKKAPSETLKVSSPKAAPVKAAAKTAEKPAKEAKKVAPKEEKAAPAKKAAKVEPVKKKAAAVKAVKKAAPAKAKPVKKAAAAKVVKKSPAKPVKKTAAKASKKK